MLRIYQNFRPNQQHGVGTKPQVFTQIGEDNRSKIVGISADGRLTPRLAPMAPSYMLTLAPQVRISVSLGSPETSTMKAEWIPWY